MPRRGSGGDVGGLVAGQLGEALADDLLQLVHVDEAARGLAHGIEHIAAASATRPAGSTSRPR